MLAYNYSWYSLRVCCVSAVSTEIFPFSFLIFFIWVISSFWCVQAGVCQFWPKFFQRTSSWFYWFFFYFFFLNICFIDFLSDLCDFLPADLGVCSSFINSFRWGVKLLISEFYFLRKACISLNFPLHPIDFEWLSFHYHLSWGVF